MISTRSVGLLIDTVVCLTLAKWETVSGRFGGYLTGRPKNNGVLEESPVTAVTSSEAGSGCFSPNEPAHPAAVASPQGSTCLHQEITLQTCPLTLQTCPSSIGVLPG